MKILILDDDLTRHEAFKDKFKEHELTLVETAGDTIKHLKNADFDAVFLDHDLGGQQMVDSGEETGYEVAKFLEANPNRKPNQIIIHSFNPLGAKKMMQALPEASYRPGLWLVD